MKKLMAILVVVVCMSCNTGSKTGNGAVGTAPLFGTKWYLNAFHIANVDTVLLGKKAFVVFNDKADGMTVNGNGGCNIFGGQLVVKGAHIQLSKLFSTRKWCAESPTIEAPFLKNLEVVNRYEMKAGKLVLYHDDQLLLVFVQ